MEPTLGPARLARGAARAGSGFRRAVNHRVEWGEEGPPLRPEKSGLSELY